MAKFDFSVLYAQYPAIISQMEDTFDSHKFILELACKNQAEYVKALHAYLEPESGKDPTPFQVVHGFLAKKLEDFPQFVELLHINVTSTDIFGKPGSCAEWRKVK
jgi:hypothetical protein